MAEEDASEDKEEEPTQKKITDMREKGQVAMSRELNNWVILAAALALIVWMSGPMMAKLMPMLENFIARPHELVLDGSGAVGQILWQASVETLKALIPPLGMIFVVGFLISFVQVGPMLTTQPIQPKWSKISPSAGLGRLLSKKTLVEFLKSMAKLIIISTVVTSAIKPFLASGDATIDMTPMALMATLREEARVIFVAVLSVYFVFALLDYAWQRYTFSQQLKMSKQEVKDEYKQSEGDPKIKAKLAQLRQQRARKRMIQRVPEADVIITNPTHFAVALKYDREKMGAPMVIAKGMDLIALKIREIAKENNIPIQESPPLARGLFDAVEVDQEIPEQFYKAVAEIISYVFNLKKPSHQRNG